MTKVEKEKMKAFLTGYVPHGLRGEELNTPTDLEIHDYVTNLPAIEQLRIAQGPYGPQFTERINAALLRLHSEANKDKSQPNGNIASRFLDFE